MNEQLANLEPRSVWKHFAELSQIPRCSRDEGRVRDHVLAFARERGLTSRTDATGNVVVRREASPGHERAPVIVLQGHLDMVCEKNMDVDHDFASDPITLVVDGEWVRADRTTLGADNGIAVAMMLAVLERDASHGAVECLFTVDEESALTGATHLDPSLISGRILINLDSEDEGEFCIGCAGGRNTQLDLPVSRDEGSSSGWEALVVTVTGLSGGHSGIEIHKGLGNAVVAGARLLQAALSVEPSLRLAMIQGGDKHNAIPRECRMTLRVPEGRVSDVRTALTQLGEAIAAEYAVADPGFTLTVESGDIPSSWLTGESTRTAADMLAALPHGVLSMSPSVPGLVETSTNFASVKLSGETLSVLTSQRSSRHSGIDRAAELIGSVARLAGARLGVSASYPPWPPKRESSLVDACRAVFGDLYGHDPKVVVVHAGLECGVIGDKIGGMDMISFGPDIRGAHTPQERLHIESTRRTWELLTAVLARYA